MSRVAKHTDFILLNLGPNHPSVHGVFRIALQLDGEVIVQPCPTSATTTAPGRRWPSGRAGTHGLPQSRAHAVLPALQIPPISRGFAVADLIAIIANIAVFRCVARYAGSGPML